MESSDITADFQDKLVPTKTGALLFIITYFGLKLDLQYGSSAASLYQPTKVYRVPHDGDDVKLGGTVPVAHLTPGRTKGCST